MASTKADGNRVAWEYETDVPGQTYRVSAKAVYVLDGTDGAKYGGQAAGLDVPAMPHGVRMRKVKIASAAGAVRWVPVYDTACALWATPSTSVSRDVNGTDTAMTNVAGGRLGEHLPPSGITQSS
jgi:hypothetical protein